MRQITRRQFSPKKILVPSDFSASADAALMAATEIAEEFGAELTLLHVVPLLADATGMSFSRAEELLEQMRLDAERKLRVATQELEAMGHRASFRIEVTNDVAGNILFVLHREQSDLLVISTHGLSGWKPLLFGSVADKVLKSAHCPVLLFPACREAEANVAASGETVQRDVNEAVAV